MKRATIFSLLSTGLLTVMVATGCKSKNPSVTPIPSVTQPISGGGQPVGPIGGDRLGQGVPVGPGPEVNPEALSPDRNGNIPLADGEVIHDMIADRSALSADTVYFEYDRDIVRPSEVAKVEAVARALREQGLTKLQIEGHCDERGTDEYNRALGERRALAIRASLIQMGIESGRIFTISYGEDKPAVQGHDEQAWEKNRRGEFILLYPKQP